jgi:HEPN domain-containing protein
MQENGVVTTRLEELLPEYLEFIDGILARDTIELSVRPFHAALFFITHFIKSIHTNGRDIKVADCDFYHEEWFRQIYLATSDWYTQRYGDALSNRADKELMGIILIFDTPFRVWIPATLTEVETPGETARLIFPNTVQPSEDVYMWIDNPPPLGNLTSQQEAAIREDIAALAVSLRSMHHNMMTAVFSQEEDKSLALSIITHLEKAANDIHEMSQHSLTGAIWEIHLTIEKALKAFLLSKQNSTKKTHVIKELYRDAVAAGLPPMAAATLDQFPSAKEAIDSRYGTLPKGLSLQKAAELYRRAIEVVAHCTEAFERKIRMRNAWFLIKIPPWMK